MKIYLGLDPGKNGAVAVIWPSGEVTLYDLTGNPHDDASVFMAIQSAKGRGIGSDLFACIERTCAMASDDDPDKYNLDDLKKRKRRGMGATSAFNFGKVCGQLEGALAALGIPYTLVTPVKWRNAVFDSGGKGLNRAERKKASRELAKRLFPQVAGQLARVKDSDRAEALLMAEYARRNDRG